MRPNGVISRTPPAATHHHDTGATHGTEWVRANRLFRSASHTSQRAPTTVWSPSVSALSNSCVRRDVGTTHSRSSGAVTSWPSPVVSR